MNKKPYAYLDGIPDKSSDLYNDAGYLNENEVDNKCREWLDLDNAEDGQVLSVAVDGDNAMPYWTDVSGGGYQYLVNTEVDTGKKWIDGKTIYTIVVQSNTTISAGETVDFTVSGVIMKSLISCSYMGGGNYNYIYGGSFNATIIPAPNFNQTTVRFTCPQYLYSGSYVIVEYTK